HLSRDGECAARRSRSVPAGIPLQDTPALVAVDALPELFNAATHFVDRNLAEGRGDHVAIECGDERVTYRQVAERVNRFGAALRALGIQPEQRVALILQ